MKTNYIVHEIYINKVLNEVLIKISYELIRKSILLNIILKKKIIIIISVFLYNVWHVRWVPTHYRE